MRLSLWQACSVDSTVGPGPQPGPGQLLPISVPVSLQDDLGRPAVLNGSLKNWLFTEMVV
jgi:hypothetical protein